MRTLTRRASITYFAVVLGAACSVPVNPRTDEPNVGGQPSANGGQAGSAPAVGGTFNGAAGSGGASGSAGSGGSISSAAGSAGTPATAGSSGVAGATSGGSAGTGSAGVGGAAEPAPVTGTARVLGLNGFLSVHDPSVVATESAYFIFSTGPGVQVRRSIDLITWQYRSPVFVTNPAWIRTMVPGATDMWAPDVAFFGGKFHLYYAVSTFGSNRSCIGHASSASLDAPSWVDHGPIVCSQYEDDWNAIDPNVVMDGAGAPWLSFGSFWGGIKMIALDGAGFRADSAIHALARRPEEAIEAPYIIQYGGYYYLFVSFDYCCKGSNSTYRIMVGRSSQITGPYYDAAGVAMNEGGGTLLVGGGDRWRGPGHNSVLLKDGGNFLVYHAYDALSNGAATLRISEFVWNEAGWPVTAGP